MKKIRIFNVFLCLGIGLFCFGSIFPQKIGQIVKKEERNLTFPPLRNLEFPKIPIINWEEKILQTTENGFTIKEISGLTYIDNYLIANKTYSLPSDHEPQNTFTAINGKNDCTQCMNIIVYRAFEKMKEAAQREGISLFIASGYRSYRKQQQLYQNYVNRDGKKSADRYSARPWNSEHQTSLAFDLNQVSSEFEYTKAGKRLNQNAYKFWFILRYPKGKEDVTGYMYESWHFRYVWAELSYKLFNNGNWIALEEYFGITSKYEN